MNTLFAEVALYQLARLHRDRLGDPDAALRVLLDHRHRFPGSPLRHEVDLSIAELLPKLGRYREALDETAAVLRAHPDGVRAGEMHLFRGQIFREGLRDCAAAVREYDAATATGGADDPGRAGAGARTQDAATFWRGVCLESLGRGGDARAAFQRYLALPHPVRAAEATRHLRELDATPRSPSTSP